MERDQPEPEGKTSDKGFLLGWVFGWGFKGNLGIGSIGQVLGRIWEEKKKTKKDKISIFYNNYSFCTM